MADIVKVARVADLTVDEFKTMIKEIVEEVIAEQAKAQAKPQPDVESAAKRNPQYAILDIPPLSVGEWPEGLKLLSREEYYES
ncbi:MAG: hypothetical protein KF726_05010 [Anaerolineae bacterium]|nr:hypothetical protein [Anaerolineae bacterium]